jgi:tRNA modification GTPase
MKKISKEFEKQLNNIHYSTIAAIATPPGRGGVGIIRVSGSKVKEIAQDILGFLPPVRVAKYADFLAADASIIDQGLAIYFAAPNSFTGEDVLELHGHGGTFVLDRLLQRLIELGAELAKPGEFSQRAFLNGKIDLVQAEAIADLIDASSHHAAKSAVKSLQGEFSEKINDLVNEVIQLRMFVEAAIDFPDEEVDFLNQGQVQNKIKKLSQILENIFQAAQQGVRLREGLNLVIVGKPNVGKSSLLNALAGEDVAIVTNIPGTTRDVLRETILIDGHPIHFIDTAGLRESNDVIEQEGIKRAQQQLLKADHVLVVIDEMNDEIIAELLQKIPSSLSKDSISLIQNKIDLTPEDAGIAEIGRGFSAFVKISAKTMAGISILKNHLLKILGVHQHQEGIYSARRRHLELLQEAKTHLEKSDHCFSESPSSEIIAEELRLVQLALGEITGQFRADDLLGKIFSNFCIGK